MYVVLLIDLRHTHIVLLSLLLCKALKLHDYPGERGNPAHAYDVIPLDFFAPPPARAPRLLAPPTLCCCGAFVSLGRTTNIGQQKQQRRRRKLAATHAAKARQPVPGGLSDLKIGVLGCMAERLKVCMSFMRA